MEANQDFRQGQKGFGQHVNMMEITLRGTALLFDIQMEAARNLMHMQARSAAVFGAPDYSNLFQVGDERARRLFTTTTEQILSSTRQANETVAEVNRQVGQLMERQTAEITEEIEQGIQQLGRHTQEGLEQVRQVVQQGAQEMQRAASQSSSLIQPSGEMSGQPPKPGEQKRPGAGARPTS
jgi:methyl-accepting chemotaxis protein